MAEKTTDRQKEVKVDNDDNYDDDDDITTAAFNTDKRHSNAIHQHSFIPGFCCRYLG